MSPAPTRSMTASSRKKAQASARKQRTISNLSSEPRSRQASFVKATPAKRENVAEARLRITSLARARSRANT